MDDVPGPNINKKGSWQRRRRLLFILFGILASLAFNIWIAVYLANEQPDDGKLYAQIANNLLEHGVFSAETQAPFTPTMIRLPGYPLFLAAVYSLGSGSNTVVRVVQAVVYTAASVLAALSTWNWRPGKKRRRRIAACWTFALSAFCPFTVIYSATILTETLTIFFLAAMTLAATYTFKSRNRAASSAWSGIAGLAAGIAVLLRPDSGLFALGLGLSLVVSYFILRPPDMSRVSHLIEISWKGLIFSAVFAIFLVPWTIRNEQVFGVFQPLAPAHAEMPGEFVPHGYLLWLRTWIDDSRYIGPMLWDLGDKRIKIDDLPKNPFGSDEERSQVAALIDEYNNSDPDHPVAKPTPDDDDGSDSADDYDKSDDTGDKASEPEVKLDLKITPDVDAAFGQIAASRIAREPWRFYAGLPAKRAVLMWFDTHSEYYPFGGELFPLRDLDEDNHQHIWLPLFAGLMWIYTILAMLGLILLCLSRDRRSRFWLIMVLLMSLPRIAFFGTLENPEPRYLVELFLFAAILGGLALASVSFKRRRHVLSAEISYRRI